VLLLLPFAISRIERYHNNKHEKTDGQNPLILIRQIVMFKFGADDDGCGQFLDLNFTTRRTNNKRRYVHIYSKWPI